MKTILIVDDKVSAQRLIAAESTPGVGTSVIITLQPAAT